jgi:hypothetical protein
MVRELEMVVRNRYRRTLRHIQSIKVAMRSSLNVLDVFISFARRFVNRVDTTCGSASILMALISPSRDAVVRSLS